MALSLITLFTSSFLIALSGALMPGPLLTVTVSESISRGAIAGPLIIFGHGILELTLIVALLLGLAPLLQRDDVFVFISLVGGSILLWMAFSMFKSLPGLCLQLTSEEETSRNLVLAGILFSLANPYWIIWWASIGLGYILHSVQFGVMGIAVFFLGHILADLAWYALISFGVARGRHFFSDTAYRLLIGCCASFLVIFSCYFFYSGVEKILELNSIEKLPQLLRVSSALSWSPQQIPGLNFRIEESLIVSIFPLSAALQSNVLSLTPQ